MRQGSPERVVVRLWQEDDVVVLEVEDDGVGLALMAKWAAASPEMTERVLERAAEPGGDPLSSDVDLLSDRELEVFELFGQGLTTRQIAERLILSPKTIESHRDNIKAKLPAAPPAGALRRRSEAGRRAPSGRGRTRGGDFP